MNDTRVRIFADASAYTDPVAWHETAAALRAEGALHRVELDGRDPFWAVLGQPEVMEVERHPDEFTNRPLPILTPRREDAREQDLVNTLINMDGDEHRKHRALVNDWFKPRQMRKLHEEVEKQARRSVDEMAAKGGCCDFAVDVAVNYPLRVILDILGLPEADFPRILRLTQELLGPEDPDLQREYTAENSQQKLAANEQMMEVAMDLIGLFSGVNADRRANPTVDLSTVIANGHIDGRPLADMDTYGYYLIVATAGHDTTSNAIAGGLHTLLEHPEQLRMLQDDPALIDNAVDEIVRWVSPVKHFMRTAQQDYTLASGHHIASGDWLFLSYASANRDERVFADPFRCDIARPDADKHLGFGFGPHYCLGAHLARLELRAIFRELLTRVDRIEAAGPAEYTASMLVSGPKRLPITYTMK